MQLLFPISLTDKKHIMYLFLFFFYSGCTSRCTPNLTTEKMNWGILEK